MAVIVFPLAAAPESRLTRTRLAATMPGVMGKPRRHPAFVHLALTLIGMGVGLIRFLPSLFRSRSALIAENLIFAKATGFLPGA
jgi:hypothetical protein